MKRKELYFRLRIAAYRCALKEARDEEPTVDSKLLFEICDELEQREYNLGFQWGFADRPGDDEHRDIGSDGIVELPDSFVLGDRLQVRAFREPVPDKIVFMKDGEEVLVVRSPEAKAWNTEPEIE